MDDEGEARRALEETRAAALASLRSELIVSITPNGHSLAANALEKDITPEKRVDPLKIRLGDKVARGYFGDSKKRSTSIGHPEDQRPDIVMPAITKPKIAKRKSLGILPPKVAKQSLSSALNRIQSEAKKRNLLPLKQDKPEKGSQLKEYAQSLGLQPTVKFKCRKCSSMSFKSLVMLKEHQRLCKAQCGGEAERGTAGPGSAPGRVTRKVYLCSACSTYYENWNLFLHMREVHNRHICLFCLGMFSKAEKLASHLVSKHNVVEQSFKDKEHFQTEYNGSVYLMCCFCDKLYTEKDNFSVHKCTTVPAPVLISRKVTKDNSMNASCENICADVDVNGAKTEVTTPITDKLELPMPVQPIAIRKNVPQETPPPELFSKAEPDKSINSDNSKSQNSEMDVDSNISENMNVSNESEKTEKSTESTSEVEGPPTIQKEKAPVKQNEVPPVFKPRSESINQDRESISSDDTEDSSVMDIDPSKNENNNITTDKERDVGIKLKLSLNNALSPVIINSTVRPDDVPKPQVRPNRPPGGRPVYSSDPLPPPFSINNVHTTIYDNHSEGVNTINKVPKLTVRVPKGLLDKESSSDESSDSDASDKLTVDDTPCDETCEPTIAPETETAAEPEVVYPISPAATASNDANAPVEVIPPDEETALTAINLDRPLDKYPMKELLKVFVGATMNYCVYCNHVRKIAVNCKQLALHMLDEHRFSATVDSITAEELLPETIKQRVRAGLDEVQSIYINLDTYDSIDPCRLLPYLRTYECFQCYFITTAHKDLYLHNRKMHQRTSLLCVMCKSSFYNYSELLCHLCAGAFDSEYEIGFRCCMCNMDNIPSAFRLMVHLRKVHHACDVCTEICHSQSQLSKHVWKHKLHHLCYRCGIAYRNKTDITNHLFWKHGTESVLCKKCLQKKWPHVYHFCTPPTTFVCEECNQNFTRAVSLKVHKRFHAEHYPHLCLQDECSEKFVSKKLLEKHIITHQEPKCEEPDMKTGPIDVDKDHEKIETKEAVTQEVEEKDIKVEENTEPIKPEPESPTKLLKVKKKKNKEKDSFSMELNVPVLNLSESDSSEDSDAGQILPKMEENVNVPKVEDKIDDDQEQPSDVIPEVIKAEEKESEKKALDIWDNFMQTQSKVEKPKTPPLVLIRKHVCESDHDYCLIPNDMNGEVNDSLGKGQKKRSPRKRSRKNSTGSSSSSSSSSSSESCCSRGSKCSCSSSSGSSSSSSSDSDSSDSLREKKKKVLKKCSRRHDSDSSAVDVMGVEEPQNLIPERKEPPIAESDLETDESETDEEFYDEHPQRLANKLYAEKRNQLMLLASVAPSDNGSIPGDISRPNTPEKDRSPKKKSKTKKRKKSKRGTLHKQEPIKLNIPRELIGHSHPTLSPGPAQIPNKITISLHSNTVHIPSMPKSLVHIPAPLQNQPSTSHDSKRASKRRRVPNKFYGYSSDEETMTKPQQTQKIEWRREDLPSPVVIHKPQPTVSHRIHSYNDSIIRMSTPVPDPVPPPILMNTESMDSSETDSSDEYSLKIVQPNTPQNPIPVPSNYGGALGTSSQAVNFPKPAGVRQAREGESVYCYCRCPYDEVSEMIACDAIGCAIEWFHFECVGIMVPPKGKWYCPDCRQRQGY